MVTPPFPVELVHKSVQKLDTNIEKIQKDLPVFELGAFARENRNTVFVRGLFLLAMVDLVQSRE